MLSCTCTRNTGVDENATAKQTGVKNSKDMSSKSKPSLENVEIDLCKCRDIKNEKDEVVGRTCTKKVEVDGKIRFEKCCDKEIYNESKNEKGKVKCVKKPPPPPKLKIKEPPEPQSERSVKGKPVKKANIDKKLR